MATPNVVPRADSEGGLGTASKYWASAYIDNVFVSKIGRDADNLIDFSVDNNITFRINTNNELTLDSGQLYPVTNNGLALGAPGHSFADLYLASGAVINFDNGDIALTHSSNTLEFTGGLMRFADSQKLTLGDSNDLQIHHDGSNSYIQQMNNATGDLIIKQSVDDGDILFQCDDGSGSVTDYIRLDGNAVNIKVYKDIRFQDNEKAEFGTTGDLEIYHSGSHANIINATGNLDIINNADDSDIRFFTDDGSGSITAYITLDGSANVITAHTHISYLDHKRAYFGTGFDLEIYHNGSNSIISHMGTGNLIIENSQDDKDIIFKADDGSGGLANYFFLDSSSATHDGSTTTALYTNWPDKSYISLGTSHDLQIQHNGAESAFVNNTGDLVFYQNTDDGDIVFRSDDGSGGTATYFFLDGSAHTTKFEKDLRIVDNISLTIGNENDLILRHNGTNSEIINNTGNLEIRNQFDDGDIIFKSDDGSGGTAEYFKLDGSQATGSGNLFTKWGDNSFISLGDSSDLYIFHNGTDSKIQNSTGDLVFENSADDKNIVFQCDNGAGGLATYFKLDGGTSTHDGSNITALYTNWPDNSRISIGSSHDFMIYHDASDTFLRNTVGDLKIRNDANDKDIILQCDDGSGGLAAYLTLDGSAEKVISAKQFQANAGIELTGNLNAPDNSMIRLGSGTDLRISHNGTNSLIDNYTGHLIIANNSDNSDIIFQNDDGSGGIETYFFLDGSATSGSPVTVFPDNSILYFGDGLDFSIGHNGSNSVITNTGGNVFIDQQTDNGSVFFRCDDGSGGITNYFQVDGSDHSVKFSRHIKFTANSAQIFTRGVAARDANGLDLADDSQTVGITIADGGKVMMPNLPTSDPGNSGQLWNDNGTLKISVG